MNQKLLIDELDNYLMEKYSEEFDTGSEEEYVPTDDEITTENECDDREEAFFEASGVKTSNFSSFFS